MNARPRYWLNIIEAAEIAHTPCKLRDPEIDEARAIEAREDARREADDYSGFDSGSTDWEA